MRLLYLGLRILLLRRLTCQHSLIDSSVISKHACSINSCLFMCSMQERASLSNKLGTTLTDAGCLES